jgi:hypothetical protein
MRGKSIRSLRIVLLWVESGHYKLILLQHIAVVMVVSFAMFCRRLREMRKSVLTGAFALVLSTAAMAHPGGGGGPGGGMGAGPPITPPGQMGAGRGTADFAHDIASQQGQFGRDFASQQHLSAQERQQVAQQYQQMAQQRRANAMQLAQLARQGATFPPNASAKIRDALNEDITLWREQFQVDRKAWQAMRDQWLLDRSSLTPQQWALQRANWFAARDAWIANQKAWASTRRH